MSDLTNFDLSELGVSGITAAKSWLETTGFAIPTPGLVTSFIGVTHLIDPEKKRDFIISTHNIYNGTSKLVRPKWYAPWHKEEQIVAFNETYSQFTIKRNQYGGLWRVTDELTIVNNGEGSINYKVNQYEGGTMVGSSNPYDFANVFATGGVQPKIPNQEIVGIVASLLTDLQLDSVQLDEPKRSRQYQLLGVERQGIMFNEVYNYISDNGTIKVTQLPFP